MAALAGTRYRVGPELLAARSGSRLVFLRRVDSSAAPTTARWGDGHVVLDVLRSIRRTRPAKNSLPRRVRIAQRSGVAQGGVFRLPVSQRVGGHGAHLRRPERLGLPKRLRRRAGAPLGL